MSTRCIVRVKGKFNGLVDIYHHHDGYPEGVGLDLYQTLAETLKLRKENKTNNKFGDIVRTILKIDGEYTITEGIHADI